MNDFRVTIIVVIVPVGNGHVNVGMESQHVGRITQAAAHALHGPGVPGSENVIDVSKICVDRHLVPLAVTPLQTGKIVIAAASADGCKQAVLTKVPTTVAVADGGIAGQSQRAEQSTVGSSIMINIIPNASQCTIAADAGTGDYNLPGAQTAITLRISA